LNRSGKKKKHCIKDPRLAIQYGVAVKSLLCETRLDIKVKRIGFKAKLDLNQELSSYMTSTDF
jgi:hypothetical protein